MKAKRIMCLLLAILMVMGTVTWLITLIASADTVTDNNTTNNSTTNSTATESVSKADTTIDYTLEKVYIGRTNAKNDAFCYEKGSSTKTAYQIRSGYYADFDLIVALGFETEEKATQFAQSNDESVMKIAIDSGSFTVDEGAESTFEVTKVKSVEKNVEISIDINRVRYGGEGDTLGFTLYSNTYTSAHSIDISQCVPYKAPVSSGSDDDDDDEPDIPSATPYVIVSSYNYGGGNVTAGQEFTLNLTIKNTSKLSVGNMTVTVSTPEAFTLVNSSNTVYIESLGAGKTLTHSVRMMARASANPEPAVVGVNFDYQYVADGNRHNVERAEQIAIPVSQPDRFQVEDLILPDQLWVGEEYDLEVKYANKGRSAVYNLSAVLQGEGLAEANQSEMVGNVESGKSGTIDFFLMTDMPGTLSGNVVVTYEDVNMNEKTITLPYSIEVMGMDEPVFEDPMAGIVYNEDGSYYGPDGILYGPDGMPMEENASGGWKTYAIIGGCALAAVIAAVVVSKKRKAARLLAELEEDNNEDI